MKHPHRFFYCRDSRLQAAIARTGIRAWFFRCGAQAGGREFSFQRSSTAESAGFSACVLCSGLALLAVLAATPAWALQPMVPQAAPPGVEIRTAAQPRKATVGDHITVEITAKLPDGFSADIPPVRGQLGEFTVLEFQDRSAIEKSGSLNRTEAPRAEPLVLARFVVALYRPGEFEFPSLPITVQAADGNKYSAKSPSFKVEIVSVLGPKDGELKGLKKQAEIEEPIPLLYWFGLILLLLLAMLVGWLLWRRRRGPTLRHVSAPYLDPFASAEVEISDLLSRDLLKRGQVKHFYVALSEIVKRVIEAGYRIPTAEKTTSEIMDALARNLSADEMAGDSGPVESFLTACDLVKFARYVPAAAESEWAVSAAFDLLDRCRRRAGRTAVATAQAEEVTGVSTG